MKHGEAVLRMYDPNYDVAAIIGRRRINGNPWFKRGTLYRCALDTLRTAAKPLTARELVIAIAGRKGDQERASGPRAQPAGRRNQFAAE